MSLLSVLIPIKDECGNLLPLYRQIRDALEPWNGEYEIIFVDDGSLDGSFQTLEGLTMADPRVRVIRLRRNFGQTAALRAAIDHAHGEILITMDGDLQNDPRDIPRLIAKLHEGYDAVLGHRAHRQDHVLLRRIPSSIANFIIRKVTGVPFRDFGCTMRALHRDVAKALLLYGEMHRFVPALVQHGGARLAQIPVQHHPRQSGRTKYGLSRTIRVLLDLLTVHFLSRYLTRPMHLFGVLGMLLMFLGFVSLSVVIGMKLGADIKMHNNPILLLAAMLELCGVQLLSTGLLGELLARTYFESQDKAPYLIRETRNLGPDHDTESRVTAGRTALADWMVPHAATRGRIGGPEE